jgi:hypothetical protein
MPLDHGRVFATIQQHLHSAAPITARMAAVIDACEQSLPHPGWAAFRDLPFDELSAMREWLRKVFEQEPPRVRLAGLWFGLFHPSAGGGGASTDIRVGGSTRFTDNGELDWAYGLEYRPVNSWACSPVLDIIHCTAYGGRPLVGGEGQAGQRRRVVSLLGVWCVCSPTALG